MLKGNVCTKFQVCIVFDWSGGVTQANKPTKRLRAKIGITSACSHHADLLIQHQLHSDIPRGSIKFEKNKSNYFLSPHFFLFQFLPLLKVPKIVMVVKLKLVTKILVFDKFSQVFQAKMVFETDFWGYLIANSSSIFFCSISFPQPGK